uniref:Putative secreted protein n=1 Tax=Anopheles darlingi TaxID=43151 RepID=A0A2M4D122_ANODA
MVMQCCARRRRLLLLLLLQFLGPQATVRVRDLDGQLLGTLDDGLALLRRYGVGNLSAVHAVLHHQHLQLAHVVDDELLEAARQHMTGALVRAVSDVRHQVLSLEATTHSVVDTFRPTPCRGELIITIRLVADELLRPLLHDFGLICWTNRHPC